MQEFTVKMNLQNRGYMIEGKTAKEVLSAMVDLLGMNRSKKNKELANKLAA